MIKEELLQNKDIIKKLADGHELLAACNKSSISLRQAKSKAPSGGARPLQAPVGDVH